MESQINRLDVDITWMNETEHCPLLAEIYWQEACSSLNVNIAWMVETDLWQLLAEIYWQEECNYVVTTAYLEEQLGWTRERVARVCGQAILGGWLIALNQDDLPDINVGVGLVVMKSDNWTLGGDADD